MHSILQSALHLGPAAFTTRPEERGSEELSAKEALSKSGKEVRSSLERVCLSERK